MDKEKSLRDTKLYVNLDKFQSNIKSIKSLIGSQTQIMAILKANAYGHGLAELVEPAISAGVSYIGVATLKEAITVREQNKSVPILILGYTPEHLFDVVVENKITQTIFDLDSAKKLNDISSLRGHKTNIHIKVDTGLHRLGFPDISKSIDDICSITKMENLSIEGIFSHLALTDDKSNEIQFSKFKNFVQALEERGCNFKIKHIADSIATVDFPEYRLDMVRVGALVYGVKGFHKGSVEVGLISSLKTKIAQIHQVGIGEGVSYDYTWKAEKPSIIGTIPIGYADGIPRNLSNKGYVSIDGFKCPFVGLINMDYAMIDLTEIPGISETYKEKEVIIYDDSDSTMDISDIAKITGTNKNDILCRITPRVERVYF